MKGLNLSGFKKTKEDAKTVTMAHESGHKITILKSKVSPMQREQLKRLPVHMADGGDTDETPPPPPAPPAPPPNEMPGAPVPNPSSNGIFDALFSKDNGVDSQGQYGSQPVAPPPPMPMAPVAPASVPSVGGEMSVAQPESKAPAAKSPASSTGVDVQSAYNQGQKAITEQQNVATQLAKRQADVQQGYIDERKALQDTFAQHAKDFQEHQGQILKDYANGHIDPKHFQESMGTGQKVATAIGLIIGGFTGGFNHTGINPAQQWLDSQINRDIEAQKANLDKSKTLLGANQELYHDDLLATNATRANLNDIYDHQIQMEANKLGTPAAKAAADAAHAKYSMESANLLQQNAVRATALQAIQKSGGVGLDPLTLGHAGFMTPEEAQKEQSAFNTHTAGINRINDLYAQANKEQTAGKLLSPQSYKAIDAINSQLLNTFMTLDVNHRYSPEAAKALLSPQLIKTTDDATVRAQKQNNVLKQAEAEGAGAMPNFTKYAPNALPKYSIPAPQYQPGQIVYVNGQKGEVLPNGQIKRVK